MKTSEIRIGNWVYSDEIGTPVQIELVSIDNWLSFGMITFDQPTIEEIEPIPLTEEWLLKLGAIHVFNSTRATDTSYRYGRFNLTYKKAYKYWYVTDSESDGYLSKVEFVHEWQNFVFVMDGAELEVKP